MSGRVGSHLGSISGAEVGVRTHLARPLQHREQGRITTAAEPVVWDAHTSAVLYSAAGGVSRVGLRRDAKNGAQTGDSAEPDHGL